MFKESIRGAVAPTVQAAVQSVANTTAGEYETVRHMLFGRPKAVQMTIKLLHRLNYAEPNDWSRLLPTGQANEVMAILTKKVRVH